MGTFNTSYEDVNNIEWDLRVEFSYYAGCKGRTECGVPMEPDDEEELEIISLKRYEPVGYMKWAWVEFDDGELDLGLEQEIMDYISTDEPPEPDYDGH